MPKISLIAVLIAGLIGTGLGLGWYHRIFFRKGESSPETPTDRKSAFKLLPVFALAEIATAFVIAYLIALTGSYSLPTLFGLTFWLWLGFAVPLTFANTLLKDKSWKLFLLSALYRLFAWTLMGVAIMYLQKIF